MPPLRSAACHGAESALVALGRRGDVEGVAGHAVAADLGVDLGAALLGVLVFLQHHHAGAFAHDEAVAVLVPGARGLGGRSLKPVDSAREAQKPAMPSGLTAASAPPATITSASPSTISRAASPIACTPVAQAVTTRVVWALEAVFDGDMAGGQVDQRGGDEERRQPPRLALVHQDRRLVDRLQSADAASRSSRRWRNDRFLGLRHPAGILAPPRWRRPGRDWMKRSIFRWSLRRDPFGEVEPAFGLRAARHLARRSSPAAPSRRRIGWRGCPTCR